MDRSPLARDLTEFVLPFCRYRHLAVTCSPVWRLFALCLAGLLAGIPILAAAQEVPELQITSRRYIVIDADTGEVFAQRGADDRVAMASLTKVFTAIEGIESASPDTLMTTDESDIFDASSTTMGFGAGETLKFEDLLYGMLLPSGNDAAHALARNLGYQPGDSDEQAVERFVARTNQRIRNMGLNDTNLVNPHGWGVPGHYSTAHDLAAFTRYALRYPRFVDAISTEAYSASDGLYVTNTNKMLNSYDDLLGGKTGYDDDAGYCLIEVAQRDGSTMISVTLDGVAPDDWYDDNRVLLDYAFEQKAKRVAANLPITGRVVTFRDPDATLIEQNVRGGASILPLPGPVGSPNLGGVPPGVPASTSSGGAADGVPRAGAGINGNRGGTDSQLIATIGVAVMVILARAVGAFIHPNTPEVRASRRSGREVRLS